MVLTFQSRERDHIVPPANIDGQLSLTYKKVQQLAAFSFFTSSFLLYLKTNIKTVCKKVFTKQGEHLTEQQEQTERRPYSEKHRNADVWVGS